MIRVQCPKCTSRFEVEDEMRGRGDRCPKCASLVPVPRESNQQAPVSRVITHAATIVKAPLSELDAELRPEFDRYLDALAGAVLSLKLFPVNGPGADFFITLTLHTGGKTDYSAVLEPGGQIPDPATLANLFAALFAVRAPVTCGPAAEVTIVFAIRGGSGRASVPRS